MSKLSWKPRKYTRDGIERYCAPACGHHCTRAAYETALSKAKQTALELGPGWKPRVKENLGWYASATLFDTEVHIPRSKLARPYRCSMMVRGQQFWGEGKSARVAYERAARKARICANAILAELRAHAKANGRRSDLLELAASERKPAQRSRPAGYLGVDEERDGIDRDTSDLHGDGW